MLTFSKFITEKSINVNMSRKEISKHLQTKGWTVERDQGPHEVWGHPKSQRKIAVPRHGGDLAPGTVRSIVKNSDNYIND